MKKDKKFLLELEKKLNSISKKKRDAIVLKYRKIIDEKINGKVICVCSKEVPIKNNKLGSNAFVPATAGLLLASYVINDIVGD